MGTEVIEFIYLVCFFLGLGFAVLSALLAGLFSGHFDGHLHLDAGGMHADSGGMHAEGNDLHGHGGEGTVRYSPLSPVTVAMFIATLGGTGLLYKRLLSPALYVHLPLAVVSGFLVSGLLWSIMYQLLTRTQSSSHPRAGEAIGVEAEIVVAIPNGGVGEIAYTLRGSRVTSPARTLDAKELPTGVPVRIVEQNGATCLVRKV